MQLNKMVALASMFSGFAEGGPMRNHHHPMRPSEPVAPIKAHRPKPQWSGRKAKAKRGRSPAWKINKDKE